MFEADEKCPTFSRKSDIFRKSQNRLVSVLAQANGSLLIELFEFRAMSN